MDADELAEGVEDQVRVSARCNLGHALHLSESASRGGDDVSETEDDFLKATVSL